MGSLPGVNNSPFVAKQQTLPVSGSLASRVVEYKTWSEISCLLALVTLVLAAVTVILAQGCCFSFCEIPSNPVGSWILGVGAGVALLTTAYAVGRMMYARYKIQQSEENIALGIREALKDLHELDRSQRYQSSEACLSQIVQQLNRALAKSGEVDPRRQDKEKLKKNILENFDQLTFLHSALAYCKYGELEERVNNLKKHASAPASPSCLSSPENQVG